ncbi:D-Ala-D-Ala carboxypeptidase family metallohydrolase [Marinobacter subterrani]|uniref:Peptidase M15 n=1 Tax=Marinobacter subterrani TaxID=1658765 RepID=A0A0J7J716_9GAMM|nr:D-Ala-D-Ala carboxypeptidase family metallohydrolase [Marinobacter subterrani]KMQ73774.1 Peptidase M15 [Marinobacter subterrani]
MQDVRKHFNAPITITSGCRCESHNANVGGSPNSQHLRGRAADIQVEGVDPPLVSQWLEKTYPDLSIGRYDTFTHIDTRTNGPARWRG